MSRSTSLLCLAALCTLSLSACETPPHRDAPPYRDAPPHRSAPPERDRYADTRVVFVDRDAAYIRDYYRPRHPHGYPPGLAKQGKVPPGQAMKMRRGEPMPNEFRWTPLPRDLEQRLSPLPDGYVRVVVGADIGIMNLRTRVVVDMLENIAD